MSWKIDSRKITDYKASTEKLEATLIFWILAAGKTAKGAERILSELVEYPISPFVQLRKIKSVNKLSEILRNLGCGCYTAKANSIFQLIHSNLDLKTCSVDELEKIYGIGRKTSRAFVVHSRKNVQHAIIDSHILKFLKLQGYDVPKSTPSSKKQYEFLENAFLDICKTQKRVPAELDLEIWSSYAV